MDPSSGVATLRPAWWRAGTWRLLSPLFALFFFSLALWAMRDALEGYRYQDVRSALSVFSLPQVLGALALTLAAYGVLIGYDFLAVRYVGRALAARQIALASFVSYAFSNSIGNMLLTGGAVRYWIYGSLGNLSAGEAARIVVFCSVGFWLGYLFLGSVLFTIEPIAIPDALHLPFESTRPFGILLLALLAGYLLVIRVRRTPLRVGAWIWPVPSLALTGGQIVVASLDVLTMGSILYILLPPAEHLSYPFFVVAFMLALVAGTVSQVPGGLGVFETVLLLLLAPYIETPHTAASLLAFRALYFVLPLFVAAVLLVGFREGRQRLPWLRSMAERAGHLIGIAVPHLFAAAVFVSGAVLLFSGALPAAAGRLAWIHRFVPLPLIEMSHLLASLSGAGLLLLARALQRRFDAAYVVTLVLLAIGIVLSVTKGFDYEEALLLSAVFVALAPCRRLFYRRSSLFAEPLTPRWIASIAIVLSGTAWLALFAFQHVEYSHQLWWVFTLNGEAPRTLRAVVGSIGVAVIFAVHQLLLPPRWRSVHATAPEIERARSIVERSRWTYPNLVFRGDKAVIFSENGDGFLMYARMHDTWVAMGDPVGPTDEVRELAWRFHGLCDRHGARPVFFEVRDENRHMYLEMGLSLTLLGEEARVELAGFELATPTHAKLRQAHTRLRRKGCTFEIVPPSGVPALSDALKLVSDAWLHEKATHEKGFSNASFDMRYLARFPVALVRDGKKIIAFANFWQSAEKEELSVDLMRHCPHAPNGTMDFLFTEILLWGRAQGFCWFNLGVAPLSGLETQTDSPLWRRFGTLLYQHGEHFYNFRGLRHYKEKFAPVWTPRYLASPGGLTLPAVLVDVTALIAGGVRGIMLKRA